MAGMERCIWYMDGDGRNEMVRYEERLSALWSGWKDFRYLRFWTGKSVEISDCGRMGSVEDRGFHDARRNFTGRAGGGTERKYHLEMEMTAPEYVIAMTSLMDTEEGFERLGTALLEIDGALRHCVEPEQQKKR